MSDSVYMFPRSACHLGLDDFLPWLPGFVGKEVSIQLKWLHSLYGDGELCSFTSLHSLLAIHLGSS